MNSISSARPDPILVRTHGDTVADGQNARWHRTVRSVRPTGLAVVLLCLLAGSAMASSSVQIATAKGPLPVPGAFRLAASNGYEFIVAASPARKGRSGSVSIVVAGKSQGVTYRAPATVTETSIQADLGALGEISVTFQRSGTAATAKCGRRKISFDSGLYEGKIEFHGEEGYTDVVAANAPGNIDYWLTSVCNASFSSGSFGNRGARGAQLYIRNPGLGPEMSVTKSRPDATARIFVGVSEYTNDIAIERFTGLFIPAADFTFDRRLRTATVRPPAPFAGSATFDRGKKAGQRWSGDLTVDMPGRADVPLTGSALRATLVPSE